MFRSAQISGLAILNHISKGRSGHFTKNVFLMEDAGNAQICIANVTLANPSFYRGGIGTNFLTFFAWNGIRCQALIRKPTFGSPHCRWGGVGEDQLTIIGFC